MRVGKTLRGAALAAAFFSLPAGTVPAVAQADAFIHAGMLDVPLNKSQVVTADKAIARAMVGNADIADVMPLTDRSIYVLGKAMGTTSLTLYDAGGRVLSVIDVSVGPDVRSFSAQVARLIPGQDIQASISGDSMVLTGLVSDPGAVDKAMRLAKTYAGEKVVNMLSVGSSQQVMLEVRFAEVRRSTGEDIGVSAFANSKGGSFSAAIGSGAQLVPDADTGEGILKLGAITNSFGVFRKSFTLGGLNIDAVLDAMETKGFAKTLAEPTLVALSGERASFLAGGEFPVPVAQGGNVGTGTGGQALTVEFKPFGVSLGFTPTVLGDRTINLRVEPEVSSIDPAASVTLNGITIPGVQTRRASTVLELRDGESFAIAGLLQQDFKTNVNQVPLLGSIPILGALFRSTAFQKGETELLIVVTPRLVAPIKPEQVKLPTDRVNDPKAADTVLLGEPYDPKPLAPAAPTAPAVQNSNSGDGYEY
ncbi:type II and III secretion system protein family protein [Novosphingobium mangrovi (ex Huang et al. 2023)]|uniref:Type II and III secretion system protein family protein n=1 Tax=Novosphingobium mangrovi (ex Huang et al. 2023) TaxID=2976432 RepID=A0ABT2I5H1_9SPHN|nr:type II and III secretion system protein family protein [Novosphingobium mangrovi (ex Huang et al. 2023)]MCT2400059.1 type II and III secretion system protein family protein [Novosphingobium mangrovi (ex Huang et al. 2023)]